MVNLFIVHITVFNAYLEYKHGVGCRAQFVPTRPGLTRLGQENGSL